MTLPHKSTRAESISKRYTSLKPELTACGDQMEYEIEEDLNAMKWMISRLQEYIEEYETRDDRPPFYHTLEIGYRDLVNRVSKYSCPNNKKDEYKTKLNCPLKDKCMCK